jgi:uncharacterized protein YeeX (DUF496 family)
MAQCGYIYFAANASMPGLLKIGHSTDSPFERLRELRSTGVPTPFVLQACISVNDCSGAEKRIHEVLALSRCETDREFFSISVGSALTECLPHLQEFITNSHPPNRQPLSLRFSHEEESVLLFVARQTKANRETIRDEIQRLFKLSNLKLDYMLGNLARRKLAKVITELRRDPDDYPDYTPYKVKIIKAEHRGIQYLLDHELVKPSEL